jgi:hypothetical protein
VCTITAVAVEENRPRAGPMIPALTLDLGNCNFALRHPLGLRIRPHALRL